LVKPTLSLSSPKLVFEVKPLLTVAYPTVAPFFLRAYCLLKNVSMTSPLKFPDWAFFSAYGLVNLVSQDVDNCYTILIGMIQRQ
jgi:hypothetical protein